MKQTLNETAKRARDLAAQRHKEELAEKDRRIQMLFDQGVKIASDFRKLNTRASRLMSLAGLLAITASVFAVQFFRADKVSYDRPPAVQKVRLVIHGFVDAKGVYREYENGEPLNPQPIGWMP